MRAHTLTRMHMRACVHVCAHTHVRMQHARVRTTSLHTHNCPPAHRALALQHTLMRHFGSDVDALLGRRQFITGISCKLNDFLPGRAGGRAKGFFFKVWGTRGGPGGLGPSGYWVGIQNQAKKPKSNGLVFSNKKRQSFQ